MALQRKTKAIAEYGDFQTPAELAQKACGLLASSGLRPKSLIEPTCGTGNFFLAGIDAFTSIEMAIGLDINSSYVEAVRQSLSEKRPKTQARVEHANFFETDWQSLIDALCEPIVVIGNPPWVTNAELGSLGSSNLPKKTNFQNHSGLDAITGKSNFDISEWMLIKLLEWLNGHSATMGMLCKTAVARKVLVHAWRNDIHLEKAQIFPIDAAASFGAAVDACFLVCTLAQRAHSRECHSFSDFDPISRATIFGYRDSRLLANLSAYERWGHLQGEEHYKWRSGVKHDCSKVMELNRNGDCFLSGFGERLDLESDYIFPMLKSSEIAKGQYGLPTRWMLVTQKSVGEDTRFIRTTAPKTWDYLLRHGELLDRRASSIYRNRPRFSVFGVGDYTFAPWKVAISGFYKKLTFTVVSPFEGKPVILDDTSYFLSCRTEEEATYIASLLNSDIAKEFFSAFIFWDSKRPITVDVLRRVDLVALARELGSERTMRGYLSQSSAKPDSGQCLQQQQLFGMFH